MDRSRVAIVIAAFNEESTIAAVVCSAKAFGQPIVVNDCSKDETANKAKSVGAILVNHSINKGYDAALNSGFKKAALLGFDYIITLDADGQHDPSLLRMLISEFENGATLVLGVRDSKARFAEHIFGFYTRFRYGILDPLCGLKGYSFPVYELFGHFDSYGSIGTELMLRAVANGKDFKQVPFQAKDRLDKPRFGRLLIANFRILRALLIWIIKIERAIP